MFVLHLVNYKHFIGIVKLYIAQYISILAWIFQAIRQNNARSLKHQPTY